MSLIRVTRSLLPHIQWTPEEISSGAYAAGGNTTTTAVPVSVDPTPAPVHVPQQPSLGPGRDSNNNGVGANISHTLGNLGRTIIDKITRAADSPSSTQGAASTNPTDGAGRDSAELDQSSSSTTTRSLPDPRTVLRSIYDTVTPAPGPSDYTHAPQEVTISFNVL